jgi:hypothetical protein
MATYLSNQTGNWSTASTWVTAAAGTLTPTAAAGQPPQSGGVDKIIIRSGHIVGYDVSGEFGDDSTFNTNLTSAGGIVVVGTLSASRTTSTSLTARGSITVPTGGTFNWGTSASPIPSSVSARIVLNYSPTPSNHRHIFVCNGGNVSMYSALQKTRNTFLTLSANAAATQITVNDVTNWVIGDRVILEPDTTTMTREHITTISNVAGNVITLNNGLNFARLSGTRIGNFSSNLTVMPQSTAFTTGFFYNPTNTSTCVLNNVRFESMGGNSPTWSSTTSPYNGPAGQSGLGIYTASLINDFTIENLAFEENTASSGPFIFGVEQTSVGRVTVKNSAFRGSSVGAYIASGAIPIFDGCTWYRCTQINHVFGAGSGNTLIKDCFINSSAATIQNVGKSTINNTKIKSAGAVSNAVLDTVFNNCIIQVDTRIATNGTAGALGTNVFNNCSFTGTASLTTVHTTRSSDLQITKLNRPNNVDGDYRLYNYYYYGQTNSTVRKNGITSLRIKPNIANQEFNTYLSIPAFAGVSQKIKCNLRFDSTYGTANPPSISFIGAGVSVLCACPAVADAWHNFDIDLTPTSTDDVSVTITGQSTLTSGYVYLDGLPIDPYIQTARWYGFEVDKNAFRTGNFLNTLTENQVSALDVVTNLDYLYDAANYWTINNPLSTSYFDLFTANGTVLDFGNKNFIINNTGTGFSYSSATNTITLDAPSLSAGTNFDTLKTSGTITLSTGVISNIDVNANLVQTIPTNLTGIYMLSGTLSYNTNTPIEIEYTNCTMVGVKNDGTSAIVTIKRTNSTVSETDIEIETYAPTLINLTLQDGYIALYDDADIRQYFQNTNGTLILPANASGNWSYKIARYGYQLIAGNFTVNPAVGGNIDIDPSYIPDTFISQNDVSVVSGYTDLNTTNKIHDYLSYYLTTSTGIDYGILDSESFGALSFYGNLTLSNSATSAVEYTTATNTLKLKSSSLTDSMTFVVASAFTQDGGNTIGDNIKIRSSNLDSELYFSNVDTLIFYPSESDRDNNINPALTATNLSIYRFKYGSTLGGINFTDYVYGRLTVGGVTFLIKNAIAAGSNTIDFGTTGNIQTILNNQRIINSGVQKASKLIPHTTTI